MCSAVLLSLAVKAAFLDLSSPEAESLPFVPLDADLVYGVPGLEDVQARSLVGFSTTETTFALRTDCRTGA